MRGVSVLFLLKVCFFLLEFEMMSNKIKFYPKHNSIFIPIFNAVKINENFLRRIKTVNRSLPSIPFYIIQQTMKFNTFENKMFSVSNTWLRETCTYIIEKRTKYSNICCWCCCCYCIIVCSKKA